MLFYLPGDLLLSKHGLFHSLAFLAFTCQTVAFHGDHLGVRCLNTTSELVDDIALCVFITAGPSTKLFAVLFCYLDRWLTRNYSREIES
jgi:hypothetical protein